MFKNCEISPEKYHFYDFEKLCQFLPKIQIFASQNWPKVGYYKGLFLYESLYSLYSLIVLKYVSQSAYCKSLKFSINALVSFSIFFSFLQFLANTSYKVNYSHDSKTVDIANGSHEKCGGKTNRNKNDKLLQYMCHQKSSQNLRRNFKFGVRF